MIRNFVNENGQLRAVDGSPTLSDAVVWIDLVNPTKQEEQELETLLKVDIPTKEEMAEIEVSSRLYTENGAVFMTATLLAKSDSDDPEVGPVTFILLEDRLITIRYHEPQAFVVFPARAEKVSMGCHSGEQVLLALLEAIVDRIASTLEQKGREIEGISRVIFRNKSTKSKNFQKLLKAIGRKGDLTSDIFDSLVSLERLLGYLSKTVLQHGNGEETRERVKTLSQDVASLTEHANFLSQKIAFLLDATLGMINIEQNAIIKIFSVAAVIFLPPTLIASIYGMNFAVMPELKQVYGYPMALVAMIISAILPYVYFKRRGWL